MFFVALEGHVEEERVKKALDLLQERAQKIRRVRGKVWWAKRRRKIVRRDNGGQVVVGNALSHTKQGN